MATEQKIIINNEARIMQVQLDHGGRNGMLQLNPGANSVPAEKWAIAKSQALVQLWLKTDSEHYESHGAKMLVEQAGLPALDEVTADKMLREVLDKKLLARWAGEETRPAIRLAVQRRLDEIEQIEKAAIVEATTKKKAEKDGPSV